MEQEKQEEKQEKVYKFGNKSYVLSKELVKGGCQGCAFYDRIDCADRKPNNVDKVRSKICNEEHKIFKILYNYK